MAVDSQAAVEDEIRLAARRVGGVWCDVHDFTSDAIGEADADARISGFAGDFFGWSGIVRAETDESARACGDCFDTSVSGGRGIGFVVAGSFGKVGRNRIDTKISGAHTSDSQTRAPCGSATCRLVF